MAGDGDTGGQGGRRGLAREALERGKAAGQVLLRGPEALQREAAPPASAEVDSARGAYEAVRRRLTHPNDPWRRLLDDPQFQERVRATDAPKEVKESLLRLNSRHVTHPLYNKPTPEEAKCFLQAAMGDDTQALRFKDELVAVVKKYFGEKNPRLVEEFDQALHSYPERARAAFRDQLIAQIGSPEEFLRRDFRERLVYRYGWNPDSLSVNQNTFLDHIDSELARINRAHPSTGPERTKALAHFASDVERTYGSPELRRGIDAVIRETSAPGGLFEELDRGLVEIQAARDRAGRDNAVFSLRRRIERVYGSGVADQVSDVLHRPENQWLIDPAKGLERTVESFRDRFKKRIGNVADDLLKEIRARLKKEPQLVHRMFGALTGSWMTEDTFALHDFVRNKALATALKNSKGPEDVARVMGELYADGALSRHIMNVRMIEEGERAHQALLAILRQHGVRPDAIDEFSERLRDPKTTLYTLPKQLQNPDLKIDPADYYRLARTEKGAAGDLVLEMEKKLGPQAAQAIREYVLIDVAATNGSAMQAHALSCHLRQALPPPVMAELERGVAEGTVGWQRRVAEAMISSPEARGFWEKPMGIPGFESTKKVFRGAWKGITALPRTKRYVGVPIVIGLAGLGYAAYKYSWVSRSLGTVSGAVKDVFTEDDREKAEKAIQQARDAAFRAAVHDLPFPTDELKRFYSKEENKVAYIWLVLMKKEEYQLNDPVRAKHVLQDVMKWVSGNPSLREDMEREAQSKMNEYYAPPQQLEAREKQRKGAAVALKFMNSLGQKYSEPPSAPAPSAPATVETLQAVPGKAQDHPLFKDATALQQQWFWGNVEKGESMKLLAQLEKDEKTLTDLQEDSDLQSTYRSRGFLKQLPPEPVEVPEKPVEAPPAGPAPVDAGRARKRKGSKRAAEDME